MRVRFAPSPTGHLHVGNARTALFNWLLARGSGGIFILRIEDTDVERSRTESEQAILEDLEWMGLHWDEGPDVGGRFGPYRQSERLYLYRSYAERLLREGRAYYCFCSPQQLEAERKEQARLGRAPSYSGRCRAIAPAEAQARVDAGEAAVVRFKVPDRERVGFTDIVRGEISVSIDVIGDLVLLRSDGHPAYNFAVVIDDALMEITHVIRGEDHISNTHRQVLVYEALGLTPPMFGHLSLVLGPDHTPLSKRHGATSVAEFRAKGYLPEALVNYLALIGWSPGGGEEVLPAAELARRFSLEAVAHSAGIFDEEKLAWVNRHYLRSAAPERIAALSVPYLRAAGFATTPDARGLEFLSSRAIPMVTTSVDRLDQAPQRLHFLFEFKPSVSIQDPDIHAILRHAGARRAIDSLAAELEAMPRLLTRDTFRAAAARVREQTGLKGKDLFHPIRVALTGDARGPELDLAIPAIDVGAELPADAGLAPIIGCRERAAALAEALRSKRTTESTETKEKE